MLTYLKNAIGLIIIIVINSLLMKTHSTLSIWLRKTPVFLALMLALTFYTSSSEAQIRIGASIDVQNYVPPSWAPPYDNTSSIRYYYLPDYDMYYDVWDGQFWYAGPNGEWIYSEGLPPQYAGIDLGGAFMVLIDRNISRPWMNEGYYRRNYPSHGYDNYTDIVVRNRIVTNTAPGHRLVPRAFNENSNRVTFMQRPVQNDHAPATYHRVAHEVPMKSITPSMPAASRNLNYGRGYVKPAAAPKGGGASRGGGAPKGGGKR
jgi:hypothetical protein